MKKKINTQAIMNELQGQSAFFPTKTPPTSKQEDISLSDHHVSPSNNQPEQNVQASNQASYLASKQASTLAVSNEVIELIRKVVKNPAKEEVLYVRLTKEEKTQLGDITYTYIRQGRKTTDNELGRIAINFLIADYRANGATSILAKVIEALN